MIQSTNEAPMSTEDRNSRQLAYQEVCRSYHTIADFRAKLLGLLPFASAGVFLLLDLDLSKPGEIASAWPILSAVGLFGFVVTLGLLRYELRGIQRCLALIDIGRGLEQELKLNYGQFRQRPDRISGKIGTESASRIVYPAVLGAYGYLLFAPASAWIGETSAKVHGLPAWAAALSGFVGAAAVFLYFWKVDWSKYDPTLDWERQIVRKLPSDHPSNRPKPVSQD
jgi:hypothetical protein